MRLGLIGMRMINDRLTLANSPAHPDLEVLVCVMPVCGHSYQPWRRIAAFKSPMMLVCVDEYLQVKARCVIRGAKLGSVWVKSLKAAKAGAQLKASRPRRVMSWVTTSPPVHGCHCLSQVESRSHRWIWCPICAITTFPALKRWLAWVGMVDHGLSGYGWARIF